MRHISRLEGGKKIFKTTKEYQEYVAKLDENYRLIHRDRSRRHRRDVCRATCRRPAPALPYFEYYYVHHHRKERDAVRSSQKFSLVHPTRGRPHQAWLCMCLWTSMISQHNELEYILSLDYEDCNKYRDMAAAMCGKVNFRLVTGENKTMVEALNRGAAMAEGDVIIYISDDFLCPENWDLVVQEAVKSKGDDWFLLVHDGIQDQTATISIVSRKYYNRLGWMYYPEYSSMYADPDATEVARRLGKLVDVTKTVTFKHNHYTVGGMKYDETSERQSGAAAWKRGREIFNRRKEENFGV